MFYRFFALSILLQLLAIKIIFSILFAAVVFFPVININILICEIIDLPF